MQPEWAKTAATEKCTPPPPAPQTGENIKEAESTCSLDGRDKGRKHSREEVKAQETGMSGRAGGDSQSRKTKGPGGGAPNRAENTSNRSDYTENSWEKSEDFKGPRLRDLL